MLLGAMGMQVVSQVASAHNSQDDIIVGEINGLIKKYLQDYAEGKLQADLDKDLTELKYQMKEASKVEKNPLGISYSQDQPYILTKVNEKQKRLPWDKKLHMVETLDDMNDVFPLFGSVEQWILKALKEYKNATTPKDKAKVKKNIENYVKDAPVEAARKLMDTEKKRIQEVLKNEKDSEELTNAITKTAADRVKEYDKKIQEWDAKLQPTMWKKIVNKLPFLNPYGADPALERDFGKDYLNAIVKLYKDKNEYAATMTREQIRLENISELNKLMQLYTEAKANKDETAAKGVSDAIKNRYLWQMLEGWSVSMNDPATQKNIGYVSAAGLLALLSGTTEKLSDLAENVGYKLKEKWKKLTSKIMNAKNYKSMLEDLRTHLKNLVIGQDEAIDSIINQMLAYYSNKMKCEALGKPYNKGLVLYFIGPPGVGKSLIMDAIRDFLGLTTYALGMKDVVEDKGNNPKSVMDKFLKPIPKDDRKKKWEEPTEFARILSYERPTLYNIDEIDKMRLYDYELQKINPLRADGTNAGSSIDEFMRTFEDDGKLGNYNAVGSILIVTSNEDEEALKKLEGSLYNRIKKRVVKFKPFNEEACAKMLVKNLNEISGEYYERLGVTVKWNDDDLNTYAEELVKQNMNGRNIKKLSDSLTLELDKIYEKHPYTTKMTLSYSKEQGVYVTWK